MRCSCEVAPFTIAALTQRIWRMCSSACCHRNIRPPGFAQQAIDELRPRLHVTECGRDAKDLQLRAAERESNSEGVIFIPPHLVKEVVDTADLTHIHDDWTKAKFLTGKYKASELYGGPPLSPELQKEYDAYVKKRQAELNK